MDRRRRERRDDSGGDFGETVVIAEAAAVDDEGGGAVLADKAVVVRWPGRKKISTISQYELVNIPMIKRLKKKHCN